MIAAENLIAILSLIVAAASCFVAMRNVSRLLKKDSEQVAERQASNHTEVMTKLEFLQDDMKDIKVDMRSLRAEISSVRAIAENAQSKADKANRRIDRIELS